MAINSEAPESAEETPTEKMKLPLVVILSVFLGILLTFLGTGAVLHFRASNALQAEVLKMSAELKMKARALDDLQAQIGALSSQMDLLKDSAAARSGSASERATQAAATAASGSEAKAPGGKEKSGAPELPVPPKPVKRKPSAQACELVGKSPDEQAATLKRCVGLIDPPVAKENGASALKSSGGP